MIDKVVYIIGAGFSQPLGLPVMSNFLDKSKEQYFASLKNEEVYPHFKKVFNTITQMHVAKSYFRTDLSNIEEILSILEMSTELTKKMSSKFFKKYIVDVIEFYTPKIAITFDRNSRDWHEHIFGNKELDNLYGCFLLSLFNASLGRDRKYDYGEEIFPYNFELFHDPKATYSVITLNYDMILENYCSYFNNVFKFEDKLSLIRSNDHNGSGDHPFLIKLHGSVDDGKIIPPTWNKVLIDQIIKQTWELAYIKLMEANHIRIIGYSLPITDSYIKYLLKSCVIHTKHMKKIDIICLDDSENSVHKRYNAFIDFHNYRFVSTKVEEYLKYVYKRRLFEQSPMDRAERSISYNRLELAHEDFMNEHTA